MPTITISSENLNEIMTEVGFPILAFDDDFPYTEEQVKQSAIWPAMKDYFRYWPKNNPQEYSVSGNFSFDFPTIETFNIVDARLNTNTPNAGQHTNDPLINMMNITNLGSTSSGMYGTRYNYDMTTAYYSRRAELNAMKNSQSAFRIYVNHNDRKVEGYANNSGRITIIWAEYGFDYDSIPFTMIDDVKKLAQSYLMRMMGNFFSMQSSDTINEIDGGFLIDRSDEIREQIIDRWNNITRPVLIRN